MSGISGATSNVKSIGNLGLNTEQQTVSVGHNIYNVKNYNYNYTDIDYNDYSFNGYMDVLNDSNSLVTFDPIIISDLVIQYGSVSLDTLSEEDKKEEDNKSSGLFIEHGDSRFKVFNDNRIAFAESKGKITGPNRIDRVMATIMPYGSSEGAKYILRAYKQTALNKKGNFYIQHGEDDVKVYKTTENVKNGKKITEVEEIKNDAYTKHYASQYKYNNDKYEEMKRFYHDVGFDRDKGKNIKSSFKSNMMFMHDYMKETGGMSGMFSEVRSNMGNGSFKDDFVNLVKEGRNANSIRGDKSYIVGYNTKYANYTVYRKGLWSAKNIEHDVLYGKTDAEYNAEVADVMSKLDESYENRDVYIDGYGRSNAYFGYVDVGEGTAEATLFKQRAEGGFVSSSGYADVHAIGYEEFNFLQAKACANVEFGPDHINLNAQVSACVVSVEAGARSDFETRIGDCNIHLGGAHIEGDARALEADAKAYATAGIYKGEDGKYHADAGIRLEANAELCSAGISGGNDILGIGTSASARVKIGAGVQCNIGFQDGEFKFKIGLAIGVGFEFGGSVDFSGLVDNLEEIWNHVDFKKIGSDVLDGLATGGKEAIRITAKPFVASYNFICDLVDDLPSPEEIYSGVKSFVTDPGGTICGWLGL